MKQKPVSAESIARLADNWADVSPFFTNKGRMVGAKKKVKSSTVGPVLLTLEDSWKKADEGTGAMRAQALRKRQGE
jgi:hypothetical protein